MWAGWALHSISNLGIRLDTTTLLSYSIWIFPRHLFFITATTTKPASQRYDVTKKHARHLMVQLQLSWRSYSLLGIRQMSSRLKCLKCPLEPLWLHCRPQGHLGTEDENVGGLRLHSPSHLKHIPQGSSCNDLLLSSLACASCSPSATRFLCAVFSAFNALPSLGPGKADSFSAFRSPFKYHHTSWSLLEPPTKSLC